MAEIKRAENQEVGQLIVLESSCFQVSEENGIDNPLWGGSEISFTHWPGKPPRAWRPVSKYQGPCQQVEFRDRPVTSNRIQLGGKKS